MTKIANRMQNLLIFYHYIACLKSYLHFNNKFYHIKEFTYSFLCILAYLDLFQLNNNKNVMF